jgi:hypothetical protein
MQRHRMDRGTHAETQDGQGHRMDKGHRMDRGYRMDRGTHTGTQDGQGIQDGQGDTYRDTGWTGDTGTHAGTQDGKTVLCVPEFCRCAVCRTWNTQTLANSLDGDY